MSSVITGEDELQKLRDEVQKLRKQLELTQSDTPAQVHVEGPSTPVSLNGDHAPRKHSHFLFLLSDSALPLGSFAFSSGLESYLAHSRPSSFHDFLKLSLSSHASTTLPYVLAAYRSPLDLASLDDGVDAAIMCTVGRRASVAQGRALLSIWERAFASSFRRDGEEESRIHGLLKDFSALLRQQSSSDIPPASAHVAPLFGVIARLTGVGERETAYIYMLSHAKALLSAAVRASVLGPYQAQKVLASIEIQEDIETVIEREWHANHEDAGQMVPIMDLWIGRHELLYSRIFNS